jgi:hypothetical protein
MVIFWDQNAGQSHSIEIDSSSFERVEKFKYLGTTLTYQNSSQEEIKNRLKLGNAYDLSVQNLVPSSVLSRSIKIKIYRTQNYNFACGVVWVWILVSHIEGGT